MKTKLILICLLMTANCGLMTGTVRYVSKTGSSTPPYTSWTTASDSIQKCINICQNGDTVYVGNGIYKEQVVMIRGLALIGAGMDSCVIDTRSLFQPVDFFAVTLKDSTLISGFKIIVTNNLQNSGGISARNSDSATFHSTISLNRIESAHWGILVGNFVSVDYDNITEVRNNLFYNVNWGILVENSSSIVSDNYFEEIKSRGIYIESIIYRYKPIIERNIIQCSIDANFGIQVQIGTRPTIKNNVIFLDGEFTTGIWCGAPDSLWIYNNLIVSKDALQGFANSQIALFEFNNQIIGRFTQGAISGGNNNRIINNNINNGLIGIDRRVGNPIIKYNNSWSNAKNYYGFVPDSTNLSVDPMAMNEDSLDFHLQKYSPLIDAGDPSILDKDSTRSDIGLYGGPFGEIYTYHDLAPKPPRNLSAFVDTNRITIRWNKNTEADTSYYKVYRDTIQNFRADSTKLFASAIDSFFTHTILHKVNKYVYKITCVDDQGNESKPSEERIVNITSINDYPMIINDYYLYQNYPNPFNPKTKISYKLKEGGYVKLYVYDIKGELIDVLVNQNQEGGFYEIDFPAAKKDLASGIYLYQIFVRNENDIPVFTDLKKMILVR